MDITAPADAALGSVTTSRYISFTFGVCTLEKSSWGLRKVSVSFLYCQLSYDSDFGALQFDTLLLADDVDKQEVRRHQRKLRDVYNDQQRRGLRDSSHHARPSSIEFGLVECRIGIA